MTLEHFCLDLHRKGSTLEDKIIQNQIDIEKLERQNQVQKKINDLLISFVTMILILGIGLILIFNVNGQ